MVGRVRLKLLTVLLSLWSAHAMAIPETLSAELIYPAKGVMYADEVAIVRVVFKTERASQHALDLNAVAQDFEIVSERKVKRGDVSARRIDLATNTTFFVYETELHLQPLKTGAIMIPSLRRGRAMSPPMDLQVYSSAGAKGFDGQSRDIFILSSVSNMAPRLGEEVEYRVQVFRKEFTESGSFKRIIPDGAEFKRFDDPIESTRVRNNTSYKTRTRLYKFYPTRTGEIELPEQEYEISEYIPASSNNRRKRMLRIPARTIRVQAPIGNEDTWLPAKSIELTGNWEQDPPVFRIGEPAVLQVAIKIDGQLAEFLPDIPVPKGDGNFNVYATKPKVHPPKPGSRKPILVDYQVTFIPKKTGDFTIPEIALNWWNIRTKKNETTRLKTKLISVEGGVNKAANTPNINTSPDAETSTTSGIWPWLAALFAILWLTTLVGALLMLRRIRQQAPTHAAPNQAKALPVTPSGLKRELRKACEQNNAKQCELLLLKIASAKWKEPVISLGVITADIADPAMALQVDTLQTTLYGGGSANFSGAQLWAAYVAATFERKTTLAQEHPAQVTPL